MGVYYKLYQILNAQSVNEILLLRQIIVSIVELSFEVKEMKIKTMLDNIEVQVDYIESGIKKLREDINELKSKLDYKKPDKEEWE